MSDARLLYLDLMKKCLLNLIYSDPERLVQAPSGEQVKLREARLVGLDWPSKAHTMIGMKRLSSLQACLTDVLEEGIEGDVIETGVWRGGASILMRAVLAAYGDHERIVWVADSFEGCPEPDPEKFPHDEGLNLNQYEELSVSRAEVEENFRKYGLLDDQVRFLEGWFKNTLPEAPITELALIRLDGDLYESTATALDALYPKLSHGGYLIVDDYNAIPACKAAVRDYREKHGITAQIHEIDWAGAYWRKP